MSAKIKYIKSTLADAKLRESLAKVVADVDALIPQNEAEFIELQKFGLYPADLLLDRVRRSINLIIWRWCQRVRHRAICTMAI